MIDYAVLGPVTARDGSRVMNLLPQEELLLARLVIAEGKPVSWVDLARMLWEEDKPGPPEGGLRRVASGLRKKLRPCIPGGVEPLPAKGETYYLRLDERQADVLRFRAKIRAAHDCSGREATHLMRAATQEWGDNATGLFGGQPLTGLRGSWAESTRARLRAEYRDARLVCLKADLLEQNHERVAAECGYLANEPDAIHDELFIEYWMIATYWAGHRTEVDRIYQQAMVAAKADLGISLSGRLHQLAEIIRNEDPRLDGPRTLLEWVSTSISHNSALGEPMSEDKVVINFNNEGADVGTQIGNVREATFNAAPRPDSSGTSTDREEEEHDGKSVQSS